MPSSANGNAKKEQYRERAKERARERRLYWEARALERNAKESTVLAPPSRRRATKRLNAQALTKVQNLGVDTAQSREEIFREQERERARAYYRDNKAAVKARYIAKFDADPVRSVVRRLLGGARARAKKGGGVCTLSADDIRRLVGTHCPALGVEFVYPSGTGKVHRYSMTLDRIIPSLWYRPGNVAIISRFANSIKQDASASVLQRIADNFGAISTKPGPLDQMRVPWGKSSIGYKAALIYHARERGPCSITPDDFVIPENCPLTGIRLEKAWGKLRKSSPTLDKIDPKLGYVRGNVAVISLFANRVKQDARHSMMPFASM